MAIEKTLSCRARKKIIHFFYLNPASVDTLKGIMTWTGLDKKEAVNALEELAKEGILVPHRVTSTVGYAYMPNKKTARAIKKYFDKQAAMDGEAG